MQNIHSVNSGIKELDELIGGFFPGELTIIGARPGVGKTTVVLHSLQKIIEQNNMSPILFSIEMSKAYIERILISLVSGIPIRDIRTDSVKDLELMNKTEESLKTLDFIIDDSPRITINELCDKIRQDVTEHGQERSIVFIDYLGLIETEDENAPIYEKVCQITMRLKALAKELSIPIVCTCQVSRRGEPEEPKLILLRGTMSSVEKDSDVIIFIHKKRDDKSENEIFHRELIVAKNRNGETGRCSFSIPWIMW